MDEPNAGDRRRVWPFLEPPQAGDSRMVCEHIWFCKHSEKIHGSVVATSHNCSALVIGEADKAHENLVRVLPGGSQQIWYG
jgi:hypothetical protein